MSERKESSVLFSLRELRTIEEERVQEETERVRQEEEARIQAEQQEIERKRASDEARRKATEDAERAAKDEIERRQREEQLRLEEAERRARIEAQSKLDQERLKKEMEIRAIAAGKTRPKWLIGVAVGLLAVVVGLGTWAYKNKQQSEQDLAIYQARIAEIQKDIDDLIQQKDEETRKAIDADTNEEKEAAKAALDETDRQLKEAQAKLAEEKAAGPKSGEKKPRTRGRGKTEKPPKAEPKCDPNDPLCGL